MGHCFPVFSRCKGKTMAKPFQALMFRSYTNAIITAHAPGQHIGLSPGLPTPSAPKEWKSDVHLES